MAEEISKEFLCAQFKEAFERIWKTAVDLPLVVAGEEVSVEDGHQWIAGVVWIGGQWTGSVTVALPRALAREVTAWMLGADARELVEEQLSDAVRELSNMTAGNLKSALPGPSGLAVPGCFRFDPSSPSREFSSVISVNYVCGHHPIRVELSSLH